jgi:hypothetical protein
VVELKSTASLDGPPGPSCRTRSGIQEFQIPYALDSGLRRNDNSLRYHERPSSPESEGFLHPSKDIKTRFLQYRSMIMDFKLDKNWALK